MKDVTVFAWVKESLAKDKPRKGSVDQFVETLQLYAEVIHLIMNVTKSSIVLY